MSGIAMGLIPWLMVVAFWIFVIWAVLTLIGVLKEIRSELQSISASLRSIRGPDGAGGGS